MEDKSLVEQFINGDVASFDSLVLKHKDMVYRVCYRMLGEHAEANDVAQDVFVKLYGCLSDFRFDSKLSTYIYRIAVNYTKNRLKALSVKNKRHVSIDEPIRSIDGGEIKREVPDSGPDPRVMAGVKERQELVQQGLERLSSDHREVIVLKDIENLRYHEISVVLQIDEGTVKSRLSRARACLRQIFIDMGELK